MRFFIRQRGMIILKKRLLRSGMALIMSFTLALSTINIVNATSIQEVEKEKEETQTKKAEAQQKLEELQAEKEDLLEVIEELDTQITGYETKIAELAKEQEDLEAQIVVTQGELEQAKIDEANQYEAMKERIQYAYENGNVEYIDALMATSDYSDIINKSEYVEQVSNYDKEQLNKLIEIKMEIADKEVQLESELSDVETVKAEAEEEKEALDIMYAGKQETLSQYNADISDTESTISQLEEDEKKQDAMIAQLEAEAEQKRKQEQAANNSSSSSSSSSSSTPSYSGGQFTWPMPSSTRITSYFGNREAPTAGASSYHKGIDIACPTGSSVVAAASGVVIYSGYMGSAGNALIVDHGNGVTTCYYHLSSFAVSSGASVSAGQTIAYSGNTGVSTGPHLHFSVRLSGTYVNPLNYF